MKFALPMLFGAAGLLGACTEYPPPPPPMPVAAVVVPAVPAAAVAPVAMGDSCFRTSDIVSHQIGDDHTLYIRTRGNGIWRLDMSGACLAAASSDDPLVMREPPGVPYACRAVDLDISIRKGGAMSGINTPCIVNNLTRLTAAEIDALPPRVRP